MVDVMLAGPADLDDICNFREPENTTLRSGIEAALNDISKGFYFIARTEGVVVGFLYVTYEWSDWRAGDMYWIRNITVSPAHQGKGIFRSLVESCKARAKENQVAAIRMVIHEEDETCKRKIAKSGFDAGVYNIENKTF